MDCRRDYFAPVSSAFCTVFFFPFHPLTLHHSVWCLAPCLFDETCVSDKFIFLNSLPTINYLSTPALPVFTSDYPHFNFLPPTRHCSLQLKLSAACAFAAYSIIDTMVFLRLSIKVYPREQLSSNSSSSWGRTFLGARKTTNDDSSQGSAVSTTLKKPGVFLLVLEHPEEVSLGGLAGMIQEHWAKLHPELE